MILCVGFIVLLRVLHPEHFSFHSSYKAEVFNNLYKGEWYGFVICSVVLLILELCEYFLLSKRIKRVNREFIGFKETRITPLSYVQISVTPAIAFSILYLLFPVLWL